MNIPNSTAPLPGKSERAKVKAPQKRRDLLASAGDSQGYDEDSNTDRVTATDGEFERARESQEQRANGRQRTSSSTSDPIRDDGAVLLQRASRSKQHSIGSFSRLEEDLEKVPERRGMIIDLLV